MRLPRCSAKCAVAWRTPRATLHLLNWLTHWLPAIPPPPYWNPFLVAPLHPKSHSFIFPLIPTPVFRPSPPAHWQPSFLFHSLASFSLPTFFPSHTHTDCPLRCHHPSHVSLLVSAQPALPLCLLGPVRQGRGRQQQPQNTGWVCQPLSDFAQFSH